MNLNELIERLEEIRDASVDAGELTVALAVQPSYPLRESLRGVAGPDDYNGVDPEDDETPDKNDTVWLVSGGQSSRHEVSPYAPGWVFEACE